MIRKKIRPLFMAIILTIIILSLSNNKNVWAYDWTEGTSDAVSLGAAYSFHLFLHELGHHMVAEDAGAESLNMDFFTRKNGKFYFGLSSAKNLPKESVLPYAAAGHQMEGYTFEYALQSYRNHPTTFNKALMLFSNANFLFYTLYANYIDPDTRSYDPNLIREESGCSKDVLLGMVLAQTVLNTYRIINKDANFVPYIMVDRDSASFMMRVNF
jgi:hypothetical protein